MLVTVIVLVAAAIYIAEFVAFSRIVRGDDDDDRGRRARGEPRAATLTVPVRFQVHGRSASSRSAARSANVRTR